MYYIIYIYIYIKHKNILYYNIKIYYTISISIYISLCFLTKNCVVSVKVSAVCNDLLSKYITKYPTPNALHKVRRSITLADMITQSGRGQSDESVVLYSDIHVCRSE